VWDHILNLTRAPDCRVFGTKPAILVSAMNEQLDREGLFSRIGYVILNRSVRGVQRYSALSPVVRFARVIGVIFLLGLAVKWGILPSGMGRELASASAVR
jgi:hypothetical protein